MKQVEFLEIDGAVVVTPRKDEEGEMLGWIMSRNGISLKRNRGGVRTFKMLCSVAAFCTEHNISDFKVKGL